MYKKTAVGIALASLLVGCQTSYKEVCPSSTRVEIPEAEISGQSSAQVSVIVLPVDLAYDDESGKKMQTIMRKELENQAYDMGAKLVDRKMADKLKDEIKLAEQSGRYNTKGVPIADYAVITEISSSDFSKSFTDGHSAKNLLTGKDMWVPPACDFSIDVKAVVKIVTLPDMETVERVELNGDESFSSETRNSRCPITEAQYTGMASKAAAEAVNYSTGLKKVLAPSAVVMELRQCEAGSMVKISMGKDRKVVPKMEVSFVSQERVDAGDGTFELETHGYGTGNIINNEEHGIKDKYSWVAIDEEVAAKVQKGDKVQVNGDTRNCEIWDLECHTQDMSDGLGKLF